MLGFKPLQHLILIVVDKMGVRKEQNKTKKPDWTAFVQVPAPLNLPDRTSFVENL